MKNNECWLSDMGYLVRVARLRYGLYAMAYRGAMFTVKKNNNRSWSILTDWGNTVITVERAKTKKRAIEMIVDEIDTIREQQP